MTKHNPSVDVVKKMVLVVLTDGELTAERDPILEEDEVVSATFDGIDLEMGEEVGSGGRLFITTQ